MLERLGGCEAVQISTEQAKKKHGSTWGCDHYPGGNRELLKHFNKEVARSYLQE